MSTLTTAEVFRHAADNLDAGRPKGHGLECSPGSDVWEPVLHRFYDTVAAGVPIRLAPKTITYTVTHPEPLKEAPNEGARVWCIGRNGMHSEHIWEEENSLSFLTAALERGNLFATKEDAQAADAARLAAYRSAT